MIKNDNFWPPFWHRFFDLFRKSKKCEISEVYNAKRGSEPSKTCHFRIVFFHRNFIVFPKPLPESIFRGSKSELSLKRAILERSAISRGAENGPIFSNNILKNGKKGISPNSTSHFGTDLGAIWRRKRSKVVFPSIWGRFWSIFDGFWMIFD